MGQVRTTVTLDEALLAEAQELVGAADRSTLLRLALQALIERETSRRLALLGGTDPGAGAAPRRREG